jgi:hypothetical protein
MNTFFKPSSFKIKVLVTFIVYILVSTLFLASYNTTRSKGPREFHTFDKVGMVVAFPAMFLALPAMYVGQNVLTTETNLSTLMTDSGCTNCTSDEFNEPIKQSTPFGLIAGLVVEILLLYTIACGVSFLRDYKKIKV